MSCSQCEADKHSPLLYDPEQDGEVHTGCAAAVSDEPSSSFGLHARALVRVVSTETTVSFAATLVDPEPTYEVNVWHAYTLFLV